MDRQIRFPVLMAATAVALAGAAGLAAAGDIPKGPSMTTARGSFEVKVTPVEETPFADGLGMGRFTLEKQIHGDLEGTGRGEMLTGGTPVKGSAGYVAMERIEGALHGRRGSFLLQHTGKMGHGSQELTITVVPDSGTGELAGLSGRFEILIEGGRHDYRFEYQLAAAK
jgi:hypothetical protein